ncbi:unnamed protein product [Pedinophyceae sp. YPF-701]|nr:unnamed protein product [Pedinophyceae sp. YPF-701]
MAGVADFTAKAIELLQQATESDAAGELEMALTLYRKALDFLDAAIKYDKNPKSVEKLKAKRPSYAERVEQIAQVVEAQQRNARNTPTGTGGDGAGQKPRGAGDNGEGEDADLARLRGTLGGAVLTEKPNVRWADVAGLEAAKDALKEAVVLPVKFPQFFTGKRKPWSGILLYGPPGTGKSYLAKAVATEADSTFFCVSSSDLVSKWMGESEKLVSQLFRMARERSPAIIFIDELDSLCSARGEGESEAARRIKTEFLVQMQGVNSSDARVLVLGATNLPYNLDNAVRRRFDKRVLIPLPESGARASMFRIHLGDTPHSLTEADFRELGQLTEGFSGSDIAIVVKDVLMEPIRIIKDATHFKRVPAGPGMAEDGYVACAPADPDPTKMEAGLDWFVEHNRAHLVIPPAITRAHFERVLTRARPTVSADDLESYEKFTREFGEEGS